MADEKRPERPALVLHLAAGGDTLTFALPPDDYHDLEQDLRNLLVKGAVRAVRTKDGASVAINFANVAVAYIDDLQRTGKVFGLH
ncbi:hypothetical protein SAMN05216266_103311 [Amycolatopsis marina]|uniref:Uncharacterized protein n=1 Tax=Amycolatopsis marina TaxID=490629 RepID=A0A1I0XNG9_9PSEU|nr:hypothetical protein [Amycolatopsis marina]SFB01840.1 hypothetical protein SAMN05216266_103311 [Amycolatopsis marina]